MVTADQKTARAKYGLLSVDTLDIAPVMDSTLCMRADRAVDSVWENVFKARRDFVSTLRHALGKDSPSDKPNLYVYLYVYRVGSVYAVGTSLQADTDAPVADTYFFFDAAWNYLGYRPPP